MLKSLNHRITLALHHWQKADQVEVDGTKHPANNFPAGMVTDLIAPRVAFQFLEAVANESGRELRVSTTHHITDDAGNVQERVFASYDNVTRGFSISHQRRGEGTMPGPTLAFDEVSSVRGHIYSGIAYAVTVKPMDPDAEGLAVRASTTGDLAHMARLKAGMRPVLLTAAIKDPPPPGPSSMDYGLPFVP